MVLFNENWTKLEINPPELLNTKLVFLAEEKYIEVTFDIELT